MTVRALIDVHAASHPDKPYLVVPETERTLTYAGLHRHAREISARLDAMGIGKDQKVAFLMPNGYWGTALMLGVMYCGRVILALNAVSGDAALGYVIEHSDSRALFVDPELAEKFSAVLEQIPGSIVQIATDPQEGPAWPVEAASAPALPELDANDNALLMYTSGTTGRPKGVQLTHGNIIAGGRNTATAHELTADDRGLCILPIYHINAQIVSVMGALVTGGSLVMPVRFSSHAFWNWVADYQCTWFSVVPTIIAYLIEHAEREGFDRTALGGMPQLRFGRSASAPLAPEMHKAFEDMFGVPVIETMGLTETAAQILSNPMPPEKPRYGSPGRPVGNEAKIIDGEGKACPAGVSGELMIRGPNVLRSYYKNPEATAEALEPDGWLHTGDVAMRDEEGFYFITGRIKELIIKGGENIAPREIDEALYTHPAVLEAAGFGIPDTRYGQEVMACVALKPGSQVTENELSALLENQLGKFKKPKRIFFMPELPKGPSGKIQRLKLPQIVGHELAP